MAAVVTVIEVGNDPGDLIGERDGGDLRRRRASNAVSQGRCLVP
jgi:hypothetical protein